MQEISQKTITYCAFFNAVEREELLLKKYADYYDKLKDKELKNLLKEFEKTAQEHVEMLKDKMIKLNMEG